MFGLSYWFIPLFSGCVWLGTLLAMLGRWLAIGSPHYPEMAATQHIAYISDIGATSWGYPLFIAGSAVCVVSFDLAFISERWLRHKGRLTQNYNATEKILSVCSIIAAVVGACGLIFLTIFNVREHHRAHDSLLVVFIAGYIVSAIFICAEYQRLGIHYREQRVLAYSFWIKLAFIFIEVGLVIAFGVTEYKKMYHSSAILEWVISLVYIFYIWSFIIDFWPATKTRNKSDRYGPPITKADDEMAMNTQAHGNVDGGPVYTNGGHYGNGSNVGGSQRHMDASGRYETPAATGPARNF